MGVRGRERERMWGKVCVMAGARRNEAVTPNKEELGKEKLMTI